ncbi:MAG: hydrolase, partial [Marmoricola sp.]|nr:hydrolase [Marmoricola sp.]
RGRRAWGARGAGSAGVGRRRGTSVEQGRQARRRGPAPRLAGVSADLTPVSPGVVRVSWTDELQDQGLRASADRVRELVASAFEGGATRVEAHVDPEDAAAQRVATFSGLMREGVARGTAEADGAHHDRVVYARLVGDAPLEDPSGFRTLLNSFLPRKRAISQLLVRSTDGRVLLCQLTYKRDLDLPGGVVEVGESPQLAVEREVAEELALELPAGRLLLTDWLPPWGGWDDAVCLVFDGGVHDPAIVDRVVRQEREIRSAGFFTLSEVRERCADFTARRIEAALRNTTAAPGPAYVESGRGMPDPSS